MVFKEISGFEKKHTRGLCRLVPDLSKYVWPIPDLIYLLLFSDPATSSDFMASDWIYDTGNVGQKVKFKPFTSELASFFSFHRYLDFFTNDSYLLLSNP